MFTAFLDTCVLWPSRQRDFLLSLAVEGMYRAVWSGRILEELEYEEEAKLLRRGADEAVATRRAQHLIQQMRSAFADAEVNGWEGLEGTYGLPDQDDEHVVAAAVVGCAGAIVTHNAKHFPPEKLPQGVEVLFPADFAVNTVALDPARALDSVKEMAARSGGRGPVLTPIDILDRLQSKYSMQEAVRLMREHLD